MVCPSTDICASFLNSITWVCGMTQSRIIVRRLQYISSVLWDCWPAALHSCVSHPPLWLTYGNRDVSVFVLLGSKLCMVIVLQTKRSRNTVSTPGAVQPVLWRDGKEYLRSNRGVQGGYHLFVSISPVGAQMDPVIVNCLHAKFFCLFLRAYFVFLYTVYNHR